MLLVISRFNIQPRSTRHSSGACPQHPTVASWAPRFSEFFLFALSLVCHHNSSDLDRDHNDWNHGDAGPNSDTSGQSNLDPALRTWLTRKRFQNTKWTSRGSAVELAPNTVHDIDEEKWSFYFWEISQYGSTALHWKSHLTRLSLAVRIPRSLRAVERRWTSSVADSHSFML